MRSIDLIGSWRLFDRSDAKIPAFNEPHLTVQVPGEVRQQLAAAGRLKDPFVEDHFVSQIALEANHWWLGRIFEANEATSAPVKSCHRSPPSSLLGFPRASNYRHVPDGDFAQWRRPHAR